MNNVLGGGVQYRVPLYQRPYAWGTKQLERLWADVADLADERRSRPVSTHFTGSLVLSLGAVAPGGSQFLVVDGQQRLTTVSILLCALRDHLAADESLPDRALRRDRIHEQYLVNKFASGDARLKLLPTQADRDAYRKIVDGLPVDDSSGVTKAYRYFAYRLKGHDDPDDPSDIDEIEDAILVGLTFVSITARDENVFRIFESLNNTGMQLTQGDLVRNYVFMRLGDRAEHVYDTAWRPMQETLSSDALADLFWMDLLRELPEARRATVYQAQQQRMDALSPTEIESEVDRFSRLSVLLDRIRHPQPIDPVGQRLFRLREWGNGSMEPLLLEVLRQNADGLASDEECERAIAVIESYFVRRLLTGAPDSGLVRIMMRTVSELAASSDPVDHAVRRILSTGRRFFATDAQVRAAVPVLPFYTKGRSNQRRLVLSWLEESIGHHELAVLTETSIEHVLPQTLTTAWREELERDLAPGETVETAHEGVLHTLGNLTLTGYNPELSNRPFEEKRARYAESHIDLTREIAVENHWSRMEIRTRSERLAEAAIALWRGPVEELVLELPVRGSWVLADRIVESIPAGRWSSYGDVAAVAGTHPVPLGNHVASSFVPNAWRVLQSAGTISGGFRWAPGSEHDGQEPRTVLEAEGLTFDSVGRANAGQRLGSAELAELNGIEYQLASVEPQEDGEVVFLEQLLAHQSEGAVQVVVELMKHWRSLGGAFRFGNGVTQRSCTFSQSPYSSVNAPFVIYPRGTVEFNFQYFRSYVPFNDRQLRDELRRRLNELQDVEIGPAFLDMRPPIAIAVAFGGGNRDRFFEIATWFQGVINAEPLAGHPADPIDSRD